MKGLHRGEQSGWKGEVEFFKGEFGTEKRKAQNVEDERFFLRKVTKSRSVLSGRLHEQGNLSVVQGSRDARKYRWFLEYSMVSVV